MVREGFCEEVTLELNSEEGGEVKVSRKAGAEGTAYAKALGWELDYRMEEPREGQFGWSTRKARSHSVKRGGLVKYQGPISGLVFILRASGNNGRV